MSDLLREPFTIEVTELSSGTYLAMVAGEVDIATSPELTSRLSTVRGAAPYHVLVDLSAVSFIDSTGIKALISTAKSLESNGGKLIVVGAAPNIRRVFDIVRLADVVSVVASLDAALQQVQQGGGGGAPAVAG